MGWIAIAIALISAVLAYRASQNIPQVNPDAEPKAPVVEEGKAIGVVFGRVKITASHVYWWGDLKGEAIKK